MKYEVVVGDDVAGQIKGGVGWARAVLSGGEDMGWYEDMTSAAGAVAASYTAPANRGRNLGRMRSWRLRPMPEPAEFDMFARADYCKEEL